MTYKMDSYRNHIPIIAFPCKLDVGAGAYPKEGFVRLDFDPCNGATDIVWDIAACGIPLPNGSVSELYSSHFIEHLIPTDAHYVLQEMWRVCANGAEITIRMPHSDSPEGRLPCHYSLWNEDSMRAIGQWFPLPGHPDYNGNYWSMQKVWRENYHLWATFIIVKGAPV